MKRDVLVFLVRSDLEGLEDSVADAHRGMASQASHSEGLWKNHTECRESMDTHKVFRVGG